MPTTLTKAPFASSDIDLSGKVRDKRHSNYADQSLSGVATQESNTPDVSQKSTQRQRPSVADLRKSFEQNMRQEVSSFLPQTPTKTSLNNVESWQLNKQSIDLERPSSSRHSKPLINHTPNQQKGSAAITPPNVKRRAHRKQSKGKKSGQSSPTPPVPKTKWGNQPVPLSKSDQFPRRKNEASECTRISSEPPPDPPEVRRVEAITTKLDEPVYLSKSTDTSHYKPFLKSKSGDSFFARISQSYQSPTIRKSTEPGRQIIPVQVTRVPKTSSKSELPPRRMGKVSDLRKLFDRSSNRGNSPGPSMPFNRHRCRGAMEARSSDISQLDEQPGLPNSHSSTTCAPSLTTEISTNDFYSTFSERLVDPEARPPDSKLTATSPKRPEGFSTPAGQNIPFESDSPVKNRIRHFESLDQGIHSNTSLHATFQQSENITGKEKAPGSGWRPIRERGIQMWRRISQTFSHSLNNGNDDSYDSEDGLSNAAKINSNRSPSNRLGSRSRARRSSLFGYHIYRTSDTRRSSTAFSSRRSPSVDIEIDETLVTTLDHDVPYFGYNRPYDPSSPPLLPHQQVLPRLSFPSLEYIQSNVGSNGLKTFGVDFGLDGNIESRHQHGYGFLAEAKAQSSTHNDGHNENLENLRYVSPEPTTPQGDPDALTKVRSQQTSSREARRRSRHDEKKTWRELKADMKQYQREQRNLERGERERGDDIDSPSTSSFSSRHHRKKDKGKQRATDAIPEE